MNKYVQGLLNCLFAMLLFTTGCITPFEPQGVKETVGILVVEGMIMETGTTIKLSRTVGIYEESDPGMKVVNNAHIHVIDDGNHTVAVAEPQIIDGRVNTGTYVVNATIAFNPGTKYALTIQIGERQYQSAFVSPVHTPPIDEITWKQNDDSSMDIMVSTHDPEGKINYYRWAFEEDWEYRAHNFGSHTYDPNTSTIIEQSLFTANNLYYCWDSNVSRSIIIGTSDRLTGTVIKDKKILNFQQNNTRFSYLYSILVKQYALDQEAYSYFENLQKNIDQSGGFFAPQPMELRGNIYCVSHPDEPVIGYIVATNESASRIYIEMERIQGEDRYDCGNTRNFRADEVQVAYWSGYGIYYFDWDIGMYVCTLLRCVDCTLRGGVKNKPDFWPNDHQ